MSVAKHLSDWKIRNPGVFPEWLKAPAKAWFHLTRHQRALPDFLIIGAPKCGTTSFFSYLAQHPQIIPAMDKEPGYLRSHRFRSIDRYCACFPLKRILRPNRLTGEGTTHYFYDASVAKLLETRLPQAKLFLLLRNPAQRAISHYHHNLQRGREKGAGKEVFERLLQIYEDWSPGQPLPHVAADVAASDYLKYGLYGEFLSPWLPLYQSGRLRLIIFEDFVRNPDEFMCKAFGDLKIEASFKPVFRVFKQRDSTAPENPHLKDTLSHFYAPLQASLEDLLQRPLEWFDK